MPKSNKPMIRIHNIETNEIIDREMNDSEFVEYEANQVLEAQRIAEAELQLLAKSNLLTKLGISEDEAKLLLS